LTTPDIEASIAAQWAELVSTGRYFYDGQLCRLVDYRASEEGIVLTTAPTSYREYHGTHKIPALDDSHRANPLCACAVVHTADDKLVLGRRSQTLGESCGLWHVIGGHLEAGKHVSRGRALPGAAIRDELEEELGVSAASIRDLVCLGLSRPEDTLKPELLYYARVGIEFSEVRPDREHTHLEPVEARRAACLDFAEKHAMVSSGRACLKAYAQMLP
jgi:8-oxo-dGTP pyrophosphatase MutT (NUDIX family)